MTSLNPTIEPTLEPTINIPIKYDNTPTYIMIIIVGSLFLIMFCVTIIWKCVKDDDTKCECLKNGCLCCNDNNNNNHEISQTNETTELVSRNNNNADIITQI
mmetsp:Transcript_74846/g.91964  ORF Transcript_74846/g.91964 Transcript_74846/m.91964 type:complete len:102 (-) Transcript_74846:36-341(-)